MNSATVKIYEFSTGIQAEETPDGGWVSRGFTGEYMNKTIDPIPVAIQSAIANREFAVAEGASSDEPAIIGREVRGGGEVWSAIAVVTRGRDDRGRSASMYRYFFCEGLGNLWKILAWMDSLRQAGRMPIFNPFETKFIRQPTEYPATSQPQINLQQISLLQSLLASNAPVIIPAGQRCTPFIVNQMATEKARANGQPVAWAYKAEALEQPRSFQVIQPASEKAEQLLQKAIASTPQYTAPIAGEQEVKSAIKGLISRDKVKPEQVQAIETAINQIQDTDWEAIFNGQGASQALRQGIYSPQMVRLLTLRAMVIPQTLPEFVDWMQKRGKQEDHYQVSEIFQSEIQNGNAPNFTLKVSQGVKLIIPKLVDQPELLGGVVWLLSSPSGLWKEIYSQQVAVDINHDFKLMSDKVTRSTNVQFKVIADREWEELSSQLQIYWQYPSHPHQEKYKPLADLFGKLRNLRIAAFFYHVAYGEVPKNIFRKISNRGGLYSTVYGVTIKRQVPLTEVLVVWIQEFFAVPIRIGEQDMRLWFALLILLIFTSSGFGVGFMVGHNQQKDKTGQTETGKTTTAAASVTPTGTTGPSSSPPKFVVTSNSVITQIIRQCQGNKAEVQERIRAILIDPNLQFSFLDDPGSFEVELQKFEKQWETAIKKYQERQKNNSNRRDKFTFPPDGKIDDINKATAKALIEDLKCQK